MPRKRTGSLLRAPDNSYLRARVTTLDADGRTSRPWVDLDPALSDDEARLAAMDLARQASSVTWAPPRPRSLRGFPSLNDILSVASLNGADERIVYHLLPVRKMAPSKRRVTVNAVRRKASKGVA